MRTLLAIAALLAASVLTNTAVMAADHSRLDDKVRAAVLGDLPYGKLLLEWTGCHKSSQSASKVG